MERDFSNFFHFHYHHGEFPHRQFPEYPVAWQRNGSFLLFDNTLLLRGDARVMLYLKDRATRDRSIQEVLESRDPFYLVRKKGNITVDPDILIPPFWKKLLAKMLGDSERRFFMGEPTLVKDRNYALCSGDDRVIQVPWDELAYALWLVPRCERDFSVDTRASRLYLRDEYGTRAVISALKPS